MILSNVFLLASQFIYSERETRFTVGIDYSEFITGSEEMMRSMDRFHVSTEEVFESLSNSSVKLDATLSGSLESQIRQLENYKGIVRSVEAAISGSGEQIEEAYMDIARTAQEAARTGATRLIFDVEGAKVQVDLFKRITDDFLRLITQLSDEVKSGSTTTKEAARELFIFRKAWEDIIPSEVVDQLNRTRMSLIATTKDTDGAAKKIGELGSVMKEVAAAKDVTFRFKVMPEGLEGLVQTQEAIKGVVKESEEVNNIKPILSGLKNQIDNLPSALSGVAQGFEQVATTGKKLTDMQDAGKLLLRLMGNLKSAGITSFETITNSLQGMIQSSQLGNRAFGDLRNSFIDIRQEIIKEAELKKFGEALVLAAKQPSSSMQNLEGNVKGVLDAFAGWERIQGVTGDVASLLEELGKTEGVQKARQEILSFGRALTEGISSEELREKIEQIATTLTEAGEDTSKFTSILNKFGNANIKTAGDADKLNSEIRRAANNLERMGEETKAAKNIDKLSESITKSKVDRFGKDITKLTDNLSLTSNSLVDFKDNLLKVGNRYEGMAPSVGNINNLIGDFDDIIKDLISTGLPQLARRFNGIREEAQKRLGLAFVTEELEKVNNLLNTGDLDNAELSIRDLAASTQLSGNQFKDLRTNIDMLGSSLEKQNVLIQATSKVKQIISNKSISSVEELREELKKARVEFENTKGLEEFNESLSDVIETSEEFKKIDHFRKALHSLTTIETDDIDIIQSSLKGLGDEAKKDARSIEDLVEDLRKLGVSPSGLKSMEKAEESLRGIHGTARKKRVIDQYAKSVEKTADKLDKASTGAKKFTKSLGNINKNAGGMRKLFSGIDAQMSKLLIRFGVFGIVKNVFREVSQAVSQATREIYTLTKEAAKLQDVSTAFRVLASQTTSAELALAQVRAAAGGVIDEFSLMASATQAAIAGMPIDKIDDLMRGARALGPLIGRDVTEAFDRLTSAVVKQERRLLDELGIVIRANDAYKDYAATIDKLPGTLSATEKQLAFTDAVVASVNEKILRLGGNLDQAQGPFLRFESTWKDLRITMGDWLSEAFDVPNTLVLLTRAMDSFAFSMADASKQSATLASNTLDAFESFKRYNKEFIGSVPKLVDEAQLQLKVADDQSESAAAQYDAQNRLVEITKTLSTMFPMLAETLNKDVAEGLRLVTQEAKTLNEVYKSLLVTKIAETFEISVKAYKNASEAVVAYRKDLDKVVEFRRILKEGTKEEVDELNRQRKVAAILYSTMAQGLGALSQETKEYAKLEIDARMNLERNVVVINEITQAYQQEQLRLIEIEGQLSALIKTTLASNQATKDEWKAIVNVVDAFQEYSISYKEATLATFLHGTSVEELALHLRIATEDQEEMEAAVAETVKAFNKMVVITGKSNDEIIESIDLFAKLIDKLDEVPKVVPKYEAIFKDFESLNKTFKDLTKQFEPIELMISISPSKKSKIELKRLEVQYEALSKKLVEGLELTAVPAEEVNKTVVAQQMLNELLIDQSTYIQQIAKGEIDLAEETQEGIDERIASYKLNKTQIDEVRVLLDRQREIVLKHSSIDKQIASEKVALTEESISNIKRETKNQIDAYKQIITKREALVSSLRSLGILSYEQEASLLKKIAQDRIALQKAEWSDEQKRQKDKIKSQMLFANTILGITGDLAGANKEIAIDMLGDISEMGTEVFKIDIKPGEIAPEKILEAFAKIQVTDIDISGVEGIGDKTIEVAKTVVTTLADMLNQVGDETTKVTEKTISQIEDVMREYLISLHASLTEMAAINSAYLGEQQAIEKALIKLAQDSLKRQLSHEKARVSFIKKANKDILSIEKSSNKDSIASRVKALKIDFDLLDEEVKKNKDVQQVVQDHAIAAHGQTSDINLKNTREYLQKIRRASKTSQLLKIRDEYSIEELGEINKARLRGAYSNQFKGLLDKEIDVIENNIKKRQGLEEAGAINRINIARKETREKIEALIKVAEAEGKPDEVKRLQELSIASQEIASNKITAIIKDASRKRRMESLKLQKNVAGNEEKLASLTIDAQMDAYVETNQRLNDLASVQKQKHLEDISRLIEATDVNEEELAKRSTSLQEVLTLESVTKDNLANADVLREQLVAEAIRKIREKEFDEYQSIMKSTSDVLGETSKIAFEINKNLIVANAAEREKDLEHAKDMAVRRMRRETDVLEEQLKKELEIEADFKRKRIALKTATDDELLENTKSFNSAVAESYLETFNMILDSFREFSDLMITDDAEMVETRKNTQVTYWRDQQTLIRKNSQKVIKSNQDLADDLLEIDMKSSERRKIVIESLTDVVQNAGKAVASAYSGDIAGTITGFVGMVQSINRIFDDASNRRKEALERAKEEFKALKSEWRSVGAELGNAVGQAITDNLDVDWDVLVTGFMKAALAAQLGEAFAEVLGPSMDLIKDSFAGIVGKGERWDTLVEDEVTGAQRFIDSYEKMLFTQGKVSDEFLADRFGTDVLEKIIEPYRRGVPIEKIASDVAKSKFGLQSLSKGLDDLSNTYKEMEPGARELAENFNSMLGIFEEAEENAGLRTLRAITEPQANQIIVLLGRQVDHLATIASNTTTLVKQKYPVQAPQVSTIEIPAPQINNDIIPDKIQLAPIFNIESQPLPDIINQVETPEINLAPRIINEPIEIPPINLAPKITNEILFNPRIEPMITFNPNIINEVEVPEINVSPHIISEVDIPEVSVITPMIKEIDLSPRTIDQIAPTDRDDVIEPILEITREIQFDPKIEPIISFNPDIINEIDVPEINVAPSQIPPINLVSEIINEVSFDPKIEPIILFNPNIINDVDIPEITNEVDLSQVSLVTPDIINRNEINIPDIDVSNIINIPEVSMPKTVDISPESVAQLAPAITTPQIQYVERITQPVLQKQPEYYPREEADRSVLSEHKEEIKISININDRTSVVSEDGMLVDAVLPMLMEEESRMKMRREKATGRRVFNRGRV